MNDDEKEILKVGAETAMKPFANLIEKLFGGAAEEIGGAWQDRLAARRQIRKIKLFQKLQAAIEEAGFEPRQIPDSIWIPSLTKALQNDDETLHEKWANLLATAADPSMKMIPPSFPRILADVSASEARLLDRIYDVASGRSGASGSHEMEMFGAFDYVRLLKLYMADNDSADEEFDLGFTVIRENLVRLGLLNIETAQYEDELQKRGYAANRPIYHLSTLGRRFIASCRGKK